MDRSLREWENPDVLTILEINSQNFLEPRSSSQMAIQELYNLCRIFISRAARIMTVLTTKQQNMMPSACLHVTKQTVWYFVVMTDI